MPDLAVPPPIPTSPDHRFPVVGIGASAGGLAALRQFFGPLPEKCGMAFVVIVHLDPNEKSHMAELLQSHTALRVRQVSGPLKVEPDTVYVIPPDKDLTLSDGHFRLSARAMPNRSRAPIDGFFRTLADVHSGEAIGIVLSGSGSDGTQGLKWIKEAGGVTMAQLPNEAEYASMPSSAISTGYVDVVLPVAQLGAEALRFSRTDPIYEPQPDEVGAVNDRIVRDILTYVRSKTDHDFRGYKRSTVNRRISRRAQFANAANFSSYLKVLRDDEGELKSLYDDLLISVTSFFRDPEAFSALESEVVPGLFANKEGTDTIRIWVTGCATGEEAYSMGILLCEHAEKLPDPPQIQIFATDVHERGFALARHGLYPETITSDVTTERLERYFTAEPGGYRIKKVVREKVIFAAHNLLRHPPFLRIDLINCRNLLIYLEREAQRRVLKSFHFALKPGGHLFLGTSESIEDVAKMFRVVDKKHRLFRSLELARPDVLSLMETSAPDVSPPQTPKRSEGRTPTPASFAPAYMRLLEGYAPPNLVIEESGQIVHFSEGVGQYLHISGGEPSIHLADLLPVPVRARVKKLIARVFSTGERSELRGIDIGGQGKARKIDLIARPLPGKGDGEQFALIAFEEVMAPEERPAVVISKSRKPGTTATRQLEQELAEAKSELNVTVAEHDGAMEELKASNEELQSINEEQRATEEELEASKEELQSINEELHTVNQEFKIKNEELGERNSDLGNLIDSTGIATIFLDRELRVRLFTPAVAALFHLRSNDAGRPLSDLAHKLDYSGLTDDAREVLRTLVRIDREVSAIDGRWYLARISPYRSVDDRIEGVVLSLLDITDRKEAERDREKLLNEVQATSLAKSNFIGVMSHELRTPLNAILGYADVLLAGAVGEVSTQQAWHLERVKASASHLARMIDDSLQSVRIESGITTLSTEPVDVGGIVREVALVTEPLMVAKRLEFKINVEDGRPIVGDPTRIRQILFNLLGNAVRYTDSGSVSISSKVTEHGATICIEDTGIGISSENLEKIFERFWQVDQSKTRIRGGTGLGLMVSRSLARLMGGELDVTSELGVGSRFVVRLPISPSVVGQ